MASTGQAHSISHPREGLLRAFAWAVHFYTALGAALGLLAIHFAAVGDFRSAFIAMAIATAIDSSDGPLARWFKVKARVPTFDGALLDNIVDFLTYTVAPVFLVLRAGLVRADFAGLALAAFVVVASAYGFCQKEAKTEDNYFLGFPSYWNLVAFYLYCLNLPLWMNYAVLLGFALLTFVPIKYIYPNRTEPLRPLTIALGLVWGVVTLALLLSLPEVNSALLYASLGFVAYYLIASYALHARSLWKRYRAEATPT